MTRKMTLSMRLLAPAILLFVPAAAMAQARTSAPQGKGDMAISGSLGFANAFDDDFDNLEALFDGSFEYYISREMSFRGLLGFTSFDARINGRNNSVDIGFVNGNFVYGWPQDNLRPYVTAGLGLYNTDPSGPSLPGNGDLEVGLNAGGGLDIKVHPQWAIEVEGLFHGYSGDEPDSFFSATVGAKFRF
jgi:opacity protein-like surface antigen